MKKVLFLFSLLSIPFFVFSQTILFDATKHEMAGNADWVIDADIWNLNMPAYPCSGNTDEANPQRYPTPAQSGVTQSTAETYWKGGISSWGIDLVKAGYSVETLPPGGSITYGDSSNPQDLSNYKVFIVCEPQNQFTSAEKSAILNFVSNGGGLFMVADHETSDRDCDDWDSPHIFNDLTGATSSTQTGLFGIWFRVNEVSDKGSEDWFDEGVDNNVSTDSTDPIICGPFGSGTGGLGFFGATSMDLNTADNPDAVGHVWRLGQTHNNLRVTFATSKYGSGRVAAIGDSSPADDGTGDSEDILYGGWDKATGGVNNKEIFMNATYFLLNPAPDTTPPVITDGPTATQKDCSAQIQWTTDEASTTVVEYGLSQSYGNEVSIAGYTQSHTIILSGLSANTTYHFRVKSTDSSQNGPTVSSDETFTTTSNTNPQITTIPSVTNLTSSSATVAWTTDELSSSEVEYGTTLAYGSTASSSGYTLNHSVAISGLTSETTYHYRVLSTDECSNGPTFSSDSTFTTLSPAMDISGWVIKQYNSIQSYTFPQGTTIPQNGYLILVRNASRANFKVKFPSFPDDCIYLNSNESGSCTDGCFPMINGSEYYQLYDNNSTFIDGPTIQMATKNSYQRKNPGDDPSSSSSWNTLSQTSATPGSGAGTLSGAGVVINEMSDASDYNYEFIELFNDAGSTTPDTTPPSAITNLSATPYASGSVKLEWTAPGDDGMTGTAQSYIIKMSTSPIRNNADFDASTTLSNPPTPLSGGSSQSFIVSSLNNSTTYFFAIKTMDDSSNLSDLSNVPSVYVQPVSGGSSVNHLLVSQIRVAESTDDFVELFNPTSSAISLSGYSIQYFAANSNFGFRVNLTSTKSVPAYGWYLVAGSGYSGSPTPDDSLGSSNASATAGHLAIVQSTSDSTCSATNVIDKVGYGTTATCPEGSAATTPGSGLSITRKPNDSTGNGQDTNNNSVDFLSSATPVIHNSQSSPASPPAPSLGVVGPTLMLNSGSSATNLVWGKAPGATEYHIYKGYTADFMNNSPTYQTSTTNTFYDSETPTNVIFFKVLASNGSAESSD